MADAQITYVTWLCLWDEADIDKSHQFRLVDVREGPDAALFQRTQSSSSTDTQADLGISGLD